jgi:hypothetical protein
MGESVTREHPADTAKGQFGSYSIGVQAEGASERNIDTGGYFDGHHDRPDPTQNGVLSGLRAKPYRNLYIYGTIL